MDVSGRGGAGRGMIVTSASRRGIELVALPRSDKTLTEELRSARAFSKPMEPGNFRMLLYNAKTDGECKTQSSVRLPVLRAGYLNRLVKCSLGARASDTDADPEAEGDALLADEDKCYLVWVSAERF